MAPDTARIYFEYISVRGHAFYKCGVLISSGVVTRDIFSKHRRHPAHDGSSEHANLVDLEG